MKSWFEETDPSGRGKERKGSEAKSLSVSRFSVLCRYVGLCETDLITFCSVVFYSIRFQFIVSGAKRGASRSAKRMRRRVRWRKGEVLRYPLRSLQTRISPIKFKYCICLASRVLRLMSCVLRLVSYKSMTQERESCIDSQEAV